MNIIAIDLGASFIKCALFKNDVLVESRHTDAPKHRNDGDVFSPQKTESLLRIVTEEVKALSAGLEDVVLCIDNEMHGFILSYPDGRPYTDYISWQAELIKTEEVKLALEAAVGRERAHDIVEKTGMPLRSGLPSSSLFWLNRNGYLKERGKLHFYTLGDYVIRRLTGKEPVCHLTNAAATGLLDLETKDWNRELIRVLTDGADIVFPEIGTAAVDHINEGVRYKILPAIGDQQAALLGSGVEGVRQLSFNMGTGAQVSRVIDGDLIFGDYQIRPYFYGSFLRTIPHVPSGRAINVYFRFIKGILEKLEPDIDDEKVWEIMREAVASGGPGKDGMCCDLSFFENAVTDHTKGSISNIAEFGLTIENMLNSVICRMIGNFVLIAERVNEGLPGYDTVIFSGGIAKRWDVLRKGIADALNTDAEIISSGKDTLFGCMKYAMMDEGNR